MVTIIPSRPTVNSNKNLYIYQISTCFITVKTAPQLNRLFRTTQTAVTSLNKSVFLFLLVFICLILLVSGGDGT